MSTLSERWEAFEQARVPIDINAEMLVLVQRAYYTGALDCLELRDSRSREGWDVLRVPRDARREDVKAAYRRLASECHPDKPGGSHAAMAELNAAQEAALKECLQ